MGDSDAPLATGFCKVFLDFYPLTNFFPDVPRHNGILLLASGLLNCAMSMMTIMWIKQNEFISNKDTGEDNRREEAIQNAIFPVFVKVLWMSAFINIYAAIVTILIPQTPNSTGSQGTNISFSFNYALMKALQHCVTEGIAFLLMQKGCGKYANKRAFRYTFIWGLLTFAVMYMSYGFGGVIFTRFNEIWNILLLLFYSLLWLTPQKHLFRRPAAIKYCQFWTFFRFLIMLINIFYMFDSTDNLGACGFIFVNLLILAIAQPVICYWTLKQDSRWWQGCDIFEGFRLRPATGSIRSPLLGTEIHLQSAQSLAVTLDQIPVTGQVKMLNFASLKLDMKKLLGSGSFSKVYRGTYRGSEVAIKLIYTADLTTEIIMRVAAEASILSSIRHPNVVHIVGLSVLPPSVCLILEICSFGSLSDIIRGYGFDWNATHRSPLSICRTDAVYLALGCARGLAAVHSYDATMCHCDVKSFNFLVDAHFNVKIADLELGIIDNSKKRDKNEVDSQSDDIESSRGSNSSSVHEANSNVSAAAAAIAGSRKRSVDVDCMLGNWLAPEVLQEGKFIQASDVYSLGTVMWEIISRQLPFASDSQAHIHIKIREGYKHPIPLEFEGSQIAFLIDECWDPVPSKRPSGREIVARLELIQHNDCYGVIKHIEGTSPLKTAPLVEFYESNYKKPKIKRRRLNKLRINSYIDVNAKKKAASDYGWTSLFNFASNNEKKSKQDTATSIAGAEESNRLISVSESINISDDFSTGNNSQTHSQSQSGSHNTNSSLMEEAEISYASNFSDFGSTNALMDVGASSLQSVQYIEGATIRTSSVGGFVGGSSSGGGRTISRSVAVKQDKLAPQLPRNALDAIGMVMEEDFWLPLNQSKIAWAVVTTQYPHVVMHATDQWFELFGINPITSAHGSLVSLVSLAESFAVFNQVPEDGGNTRLIEGSNLYVNQTANVNRNAKTLKTILKDLKQHREVHSVLSFYLTENRESVTSGAAFGVSASGGYNMMCTLHAYPIHSGNHVTYHDLSNSSTSPANPKVKDGAVPVYYAVQFSELKEQEAVEPEINLHDEMTGIYASRKGATLTDQLKSSFSGNEGIMGRFFSRPAYSSLTQQQD